jgi:hypothetical protein
MKLKNEVYDALRFVAELLLPGLATFCVALGQIWGIPMMVPISATIIALDTLLGGLIHVSNKKFKSSNS